MDLSFKRVVTTHDADGMAVLASSDRLTPVPIDSGDAEFRMIWATPTVPVDLNAGTDGELEAGKTIRSGSVIRMVDLLPGCVSPMHRSFSIDYGIVLAGSLELELDGGEVVGLEAGDVVVQRGTNHLWRNSSHTERCRIAFVLTEAAPVRIGSRVLEEIHP